jgi:hypothetical protein
MTMKRDIWFDMIYNYTAEIKSSDLDITMDWTDLHSYKEHLDVVLSRNNVTGVTAFGLVAMAAEFMQEPEYIQLSAEYFKEVKDKGDFKDKLEKELEEKGGVSKTKSGKQKL